MLPALQPSRPKFPHQDNRPSYIHQQTRSLQSPSNTPTSPSNAPKPAIHQNKPGTQIEAMPPLAAPLQFLQNQNPSLASTLYDPSTRHPVFFTEQLRKPPFPIPQYATQGVNPVAFGYVLDARRVDAAAGGRTKL